MNGDEPRIVKLLIAALAILTLLVIGLAVLFGIAFTNVKNSIAFTNRDADIVEAIRSLKVVNGQNGLDGLSIQGSRGKDGLDSHSTTTIIQQSVSGTNGASAYDIWLHLGNSGTPQDFLDSLKQVVPCPNWQTDGHGNYRCHDSDDWLPINEATQ